MTGVPAGPPGDTTPAEAIEAAAKVRLRQYEPARRPGHTTNHNRGDTMTRTMGDAIHVNVAALHAASPQIAAGYVTGSADVAWTPADWALFPGVPHITIDQGFTGSPVPSAIVRDVEPSAWSPANAVNRAGWTAARPTIYCDRNDLSREGGVLQSGWKGDIWLAYPGWTVGTPLPTAPGCNYVAVQTAFNVNNAFDWSFVIDDTWPDATQPMPAGVPAAQVGALLYNASGADMLGWQHTATGNQGQDKPGLYALDAAGNLSLSITGAAGTFCQVWGPAFGPHGIYEARIFLPDDGHGNIADWPAWWLYGGNNADELDIIEGLGGKSAVHLWWAGGNAGLGWMTDTGASTGTSICKPGWHTGTAVISANSVQVYLDGHLFATYPRQPLTTQLNVVHDIMAGTPGDTNGPIPAPVPSTYLAAYTRVWALAAPVPPTPPVSNWQENMMRALPTLKQGATGGDVATVQALCIARGHPTAVDQQFGPLTDASVRAVQTAAHIGVDGVVGPQTWPALMGV